MNFLRIFLAAVGAFFAYFAIGGAMFVTMPFIKDEFAKFPAVYRDKEGQMSHMPGGMLAIFVSILVLATLYAMLGKPALNVAAGAQMGATFGALIGVFVITAFVIHNFVNLNISWKLTMQQSLAYFVEWLVVGIVIGLIYRPAM